MSLIARRITHQFDVVTPCQEGSNDEEEIARNLEGLTHRILEYARVETFLASTKDTWWEYRIGSADC